jgi:4a-hydroxytetrahydrobiopterin dehydratase
MPDPLDAAAIQDRLSATPGWEREGDCIRRGYTFESYGAGVAFANRVAGLAESADHHPDILIGYCRVELSLTSHDAGGLTSRDFDLARRIDSVP